MTLQDFKRLMEVRPFKPFRIIMSSGDRYEIRHPEMAYLMRTKLLIGLDPDEQWISDDWRLCSLLRVTAVEPIKTRAVKRRKTA